MSAPILDLRMVNVTGLPDGGPVSIRVRPGEILEAGRDSLGWNLPDPSLWISGRHFEMRFEGGAWMLYDLSRNGTFLNGAGTRVRSPCRIHAGDRLQVGHYTIHVDLQGEDAGQGVGQNADQNGDRNAAPGGGGGWGAAPAQAFGAADPSARIPPGKSGIWSMRGTSEAAETGPPPESFRQSWPGEGQNGSPGHGDTRHAEAPPPSQMPGPVPMPGAVPGPVPGPMPGSEQGPPSGLDSGPAPVPMPGPVPDPVPGLAPQPAPQSAPQSAPAAPGPFPTLERAPPAAPPVNPQGQHPGQHPGQHHGQHPGHPGGGSELAGALALLEAIGAAAGLPAGTLTRNGDPGATAAEIGQALRVVTEDLAALLQVRTVARRATRVTQQTSIQREHNNPLKFMPSPDEALQVMFGTPRPGYQRGASALRSGFADLKRHQYATQAAIPKALERLLDDLAPEAIEQRLGGGGLFGKKAKAWETYVERWDARVQAHDNGMLDVFMTYFADAYDQQDRS